MAGGTDPLQRWPFIATAVRHTMSLSLCGLETCRRGPVALRWAVGWSRGGRTVDVKRARWAMERGHERGIFHHWIAIAIQHRTCFLCDLPSWERLAETKGGGKAQKPGTSSALLSVTERSSPNNKARCTGPSSRKFPLGTETRWMARRRYLLLTQSPLSDAHERCRPTP